MAIDPQALDAAFTALATYDWGGDTAPLALIDAAIVAAHGQAALRADLETRLSAILGGDAPRAAKDHACRTLSLIATAASVPSVAVLLHDADMSHMARYVLERIGGPEARAAIRKSLETAPESLAVGMISSLADLGDAAAVPLLAARLGSAPPIAVAAARALGRIATPEAAAALAAATPAGPVTDAARDSLLEIAEARLAAGDRGGAKAIYESLRKAVGDVPADHRDRLFLVAAIRGLVASADDTVASR